MATLEIKWLNSKIISCLFLLFLGQFDIRKRFWGDLIYNMFVYSSYKINQLQINSSHVPKASLIYLAMLVFERWLALQMPNHFWKLNSEDLITKLRLLSI